MLEAVEGVYRNGQVELLETPPERDEARVIVTFLPPEGESNGPKSPLTPAQAADLRARLRSFAEDWDRPDMDVYNDL